MTGDAETQPVESVDSLSQLADMMDDEAGSEPGEQEEGQEAETGSEDAPEGEEAEDQEEQKEEPTITLKHDGKEIPLKQSEVIELAQKGFDYSQKTMAVAEERKQVESAKAQANEYREHNEKALENTLARLNAFVEFMGSQVGNPPPVELAQQDVGLYVAQKEQYEARKGQLDRALAAIQNVQGETQRKRQEWIAQQAEETEKALRDTLPGFGEKTIDDLADYLGKVGITPKNSEAGYVQKGLWELAHKAKAYDALMAEKAKIKPTAPLTKVQKPGASNQTNQATQKEADAMKRYKAKPSVDALADLIG